MPGTDWVNHLASKWLKIQACAARQPRFALLENGAMRCGPAWRRSQKKHGTWPFLSPRHDLPDLESRLIRGWALTAGWQ